MGKKTLLHASFKGETDRVKKMLKYDRYRRLVTYGDRAAGRAVPLHLAAYKGHNDIVKLLLMAGTPVDITDKGSFTPCVARARAGRRERR